jgi:hypothetical protein
MDMGTERIHGIDVRGLEPKDLVLSDGSRLCLHTEATERGRVMWRRDSNGEGSTDEALSVPDAVDLAGDEYTSYVVVRTRSEIEWLRATAEWFADQADRLTDELDSAAPAPLRPVA